MFVEYADGHNGFGRQQGKNTRDNMTHKLILTGRNQGIISGVLDVVEFDNDMIKLDTSMGHLLIKGRELKVKAINLEKGEAEIEGNVDNILYTQKQGGESVISRLFK